MGYRSYREYPEIEELYVLHKYYIGGSQGDENSLEEIITTGNDIEALQQIGEQMFPPDTRHGWNWYEYIIMTNTATEEGKRLYDEQKAIWKEQWKQIDEHPENYVGALICGSRDEGPIAVWMTPNPALDTSQTYAVPTSTATFMIFDVSDK
jgi:hypothetical protein